MARLLPRPARRPFLEEGAHALAKVRARVSEGDKIVAAFQATALLDAAHGFLGHPKGDGSVGGHLEGDGLDARLDLRRGHDLVHEARRVRLLRRDEPRAHDHLLDARRPEELHAARVVLHGEAVTERARDGEAEARLRGSDADVAHGGDGEPAPHREPLDLGDDRLAHALEARRAPLAIALVLEAVLRRLEALELTDVGASYEGLAARAPQHKDP